VNGQTLGTAPQKLADGDQIDIVGYVFDFQRSGGTARQHGPTRLKHHKVPSVTESP
jgi:hypothetical protein